MAAAWRGRGSNGFLCSAQGDITYVQYRFWQERTRVVELLLQRATVLVCGDGRHMATAVGEIFNTHLQ